MSHVFWSAPRPFMRNGPIPTMPLRLGGRPVGYGGFFMGAEPTFNRLDGLTVGAIVGRIQLVQALQDAVNTLKTPPKEQSRSRYAQVEATCESAWREAGGDTKFTPMNADEKSLLDMVHADPTSGELADLAKADSWFTAHFAAQGFITSAETCAALKKPVSENEGPLGEVPVGGQGWRAVRSYEKPAVSAALRCYFFDLAAQPSVGGQGWHPVAERVAAARHPKDVAFVDDKFFCSGAALRADTLAHYGIDPNMTWGRVKQWVTNAQVMEEAMAKYPWPPPIDTAPHYYWNAETQAERVKLIQTATSLTPEAVRIWVTLNVLKNYDAMSNAIQSDMKKKAKKKKRQALIRLVVSAIVGIVAAIILPLAIAAIAIAIKTAVQTYIDVRERQKAAKAMSQMAKQFDKDAPAFAEEVRTTSKVLDEAAALQAANAPLTPEEQAAIDEDAPPPGVSPFVPIGIAAAGAATAGALLL